MKFIFYIGAFNAIFFSTLLLKKKAKALHDKVLVYWLIYLGLFIGIYSIYSHGLFINFHLLSVSFISLFLVHGAFLYIYTSTLIADYKAFNRKLLIHLIPFILFNFYILVSSFFPSISESITMENVHSDRETPFLFNFFLVLTALSGPFYFALTLKLLKAHDINIFNNFSNAENINLEWLRKLVYVFGIIWTALIIITVIHHIFNYFSMVFCTDSLFISLSVFVLLIGYFGLMQKVIYGDDYNPSDNRIIESKSKYYGSRLMKSEADGYTERLNNLMESSQPYLNPELSLQQLAADIEITPHYLSQVINEKFQSNFFNYINKYRVEEVKSRLVDPKYDHYTLLGIAFDSGFNSKSAFNRIFKGFTNLTPTQYRNSLRNR